MSGMQQGGYPTNILETLLHQSQLPRCHYNTPYVLGNFCDFADAAPAPDSSSDVATAIQAPMKSKSKTRQPRISRLRNAHRDQAKAMWKASNLSGGLGS